MNHRHSHGYRSALLGGLLLSLSASGFAQDEAMALGKRLFTQDARPACAICHTLEDAGAVGQVGPVLDEIKPDAQRVINAVTNGVGAMPSFKGWLSEEQIRAIAKYVSTVTGGAR